MQRSLAEIKMLSDQDAVRSWLAERGFVAVDRDLADKVLGKSSLACFDASADRYVKVFASRLAS